jgi:hypothetical protein
MEPKPMVNWDWDAMLEMRALYEDDFKQVTHYPSNWKGKRGTVDRDKGHYLGIATSWA